MNSLRQIKFGQPMISEAEKNAVIEVMGGDVLVHGPKDVEFENIFREFTGSKYAVSLSSCTAALHLSYLCLGIGNGDEVIVSSQTHIATVHAIELVGAKPVFVDSEEMSGNINPALIESKITNHTKAISPVHFLGYPADMKKICTIAKKYNLKIIEDCALAVGSKIENIHCGNFGETGCFSFYPVKHITTAEGGMMITNNEEIFKLATKKKAFGVDRTFSERQVPGMYDVIMLGLNYRMNELQAAIGIEQMKKVSGFLEKRKNNFNVLYAELKELDDIKIFNYPSSEIQHSYYCFTFILDGKLSGKRIEFVKYLNEHGVGTSIYYPKPAPMMTYYKQKYNLKENDFPIACKIADQSIALPVGPHLNEDDMNYIIHILKKGIFK